MNFKDLKRRRHDIRYYNEAHGKLNAILCWHKAGNLWIKFPIIHRRLIFRLRRKNKDELLEISMRSRARVK